jgi:hypothetical protein
MISCELAEKNKKDQKKYNDFDDAHSGFFFPAISPPGPCVLARDVA